MHMFGANLENKTRYMRSIDYTNVARSEERRSNAQIIP
jgi:hypothetical protein